MTSTRIKTQRISCDNFSPFGTVAQLGAEAPLARTPQFTFWSDRAAFHIDGETEIGYCTVRAPKDDAVDWMERHERTPEVLIPVDWPIVLPVMHEDGTVESFELHPGEAVVIGQNVWHSACRPLGQREATYFVIFRRGTPHEDVVKKEIEAVTIARGEE